MAFLNRTFQLCLPSKIPISRPAQLQLMPSCPHPSLVIVILWGISIAATTFLFIGNPHLTWVIALQGICMIGSAVYTRNFVAGKGCPINSLLSRVFRRG
jgi:hypothetical protein